MCIVGSQAGCTYFFWGSRLAHIGAVRWGSRHPHTSLEVPTPSRYQNLPHIAGPPFIGKLDIATYCVRV